MNIKDFDKPGPLLSKLHYKSSYAHERSLRDILEIYYSDRDMPDPQDLACKYIKAVCKDNDSTDASGTDDSGSDGYVTRIDGSEGEGHSFIKEVTTDDSGALKIYYTNHRIPFIYAPGTWDTFVPEKID